MTPIAKAAMPRSASISHYLILIGAQFAVGSAAILARLGLEAGLSATALAVWRLTVASTLLAAALRLAAWRRERGSVSGAQTSAGASLSRRQIAHMLIAGLCLGLHFALWFASLSYIPVARSTLLVTTCPVWTGMAGWLFLRQRMPTTFWMGLAVAAGGVLLITTGSASASPLRPAHTTGLWMGDMLAVGGAIMVAPYLLLVQNVQARLGTWRTVVWTYSAAAASLWPVALWTSGGASSLMPHSRTAWLSVTGMALVPQLIGHTALNWSLKRFSAGAVAAATLMEPVFASVLAWWIFGETLTGRQVFGAAILLIGVGCALRRSEGGKGAS